MIHSYQNSITYQEIVSQAERLDLLLARWGNGAQWSQRSRNVLFLGCGSSFYLAAYAAQVWRSRLGLHAQAVPASEFLIRPEAWSQRNVPAFAFGISRTGETTETLLALAQARDRHGLQIAPVTCSPDSTLAKLSSNALSFPEVAERGTVMTRAFTGILACFLECAGCGREVRKLPALISASLDQHQGFLDSLAQQPFENAVFLGTGPFLQIARESALKVREMTGGRAEAHQLFEFRHGHHVVLQPGTLIWVFTGPKDLPYLPGVFPELKRSGATLLVCGVDVAEDLQSAADLVLNLRGPVGASDVEALGLLHLAQLYACFRTIRLGLDPDHPQNLNRVTLLPAAASAPTSLNLPQT
jgi:glucosamine--fructose-6-phosphate aminotransferase (isomerizing)